MTNEWVLLIIALAVLAALGFGLYHLIAAAVRRGQRDPR